MRQVNNEKSLDEAHYFKKYLEVAPFSHALWRGVEVYTLAHESSALLGKKKQHHIFAEPLLDIGCGFGEFAGVFFNKKVEVGIDIDSRDLVMARRGKRYRKLLMADARKLPFVNNIFATVISLSVLEHIPRVEAVFAEVYRVLKPKGIFMFTVPTKDMSHFLFYPHLFRSIGMNMFATFYEKTMHRLFQHVNLFSRERWVNMVKKEGFQILQVHAMFPAKLVTSFDFFLPLALITQISRKITGRRFIFRTPIERKLLTGLFMSILQDKELTDSNILVIARKI